MLENLTFFNGCNHEFRPFPYNFFCPAQNSNMTTAFYTNDTLLKTLEMNLLDVWTLIISMYYFHDANAD